MPRGSRDSAFPYGFPAYGSCRFCKASCVLHSEMVKYGERHWAHPVCLYKRKGIEAINELQTWQIRHLPVLLMMEAGVSVEQVHEWSRRIKDDEARIKREERERKRAARAQGRR